MLFISILVFLISSKAHQFDLDPRIVRGTPINANQYPWIASLRYSYTFNSTTTELNFCTGSLIQLSPPIVLTAAHCVDFLAYGNWTTDPVITIPSNPMIPKQTPLQIYVDVNRTYPKDTVLGDVFTALPITNLSQIIMHPLWNTSKSASSSSSAEFWAEFDDIAVITFDYDYTSILPNINEIDMPILPDALGEDEVCCQVGDEYIAMGYGRDETGQGTYSLEQTMLKYVDEVSCWSSIYALAYQTNDMAFIKKQMNITGIAEDNTEFCVIGNNTDVCQGDSGGPLIMMNANNKAEIIGVTSYSWSGCQSGVPSAFQSVAHFRTWIDEQIAKVTTTMAPSADPTDVPTIAPSTSPSISPTASPTVSSFTPSQSPTTAPAKQTSSENDDDDVSNSANKLEIRVFLGVWFALFINTVICAL